MQRKINITWRVLRHATARGRARKLVRWSERKSFGVNMPLAGLAGAVSDSKLVPSIVAYRENTSTHGIQNMLSQHKTPLQYAPRGGVALSRGESHTQDLGFSRRVSATFEASGEQYFLRAPLPLLKRSNATETP